MKKYSYVLILISVAFQAYAYQNPFPYDDPANEYNISNVGDDGIADPCVIKWMGKYYLYVTNTEGNVWESDDLVHWKFKQASTPGDSSHQWAPDVFYYDGKFYRHTSGPNSWQRRDWSWFPWGPYQDRIDEVNPSIDGNVFLDDDGQLYFSFASSGGISFRLMESPTEIYGYRQLISGTDISLGKDYDHWVEGPQIFKINEKYYITYCGNSYTRDDYQVHAGKGESVASLISQANNPILTSTTGRYRGTGHNCVVLGPDLKTHYIIYHVNDTGSPLYIPGVRVARKLMVDKAYVDPITKNFRTDGPSFDIRPNPSLPDWYDRFNRTGLGSGWTIDGAGNWFLLNDGLLPNGTKLVRDSAVDPASFHMLTTTNSTSKDFIAEFNLRVSELPASGQEPMLGVVVSYEKESNSGFYVYIYPKDYPLRDFVKTRLLLNGKDVPLTGGDISNLVPRDNWNHWAFQNVRIEKRGNEFRVFLHDMLLIKRYGDIGALKGGKVGFVLSNCGADYSYTAFSNIRRGPPLLHKMTEIANGNTSVEWSNLESSMPNIFDAIAYDMYLEEWKKWNPDNNIRYLLSSDQTKRNADLNFTEGLSFEHSGGYHLWIRNDYGSNGIIPCGNPKTTVIYKAKPHTPIRFSATIASGKNVTLNWKPDRYGTFYYSIMAYEWIEINGRSVWRPVNDLSGPSGKQLWQLVYYNTDDFENGTTNVVVPRSGTYAFYIFAAGWEVDQATGKYYMSDPAMASMDIAMAE